MRGAVVFLIVFAVMLVATLAYSDMPPGIQIYNSLGLPSTDYNVVGIPATTLIVAVFNGVIYGVIAWLVFTFVEKARKKQEQK